MSSHQSQKTPPLWSSAARALGVAALVLSPLGGCGSVGPSQRTEEASARKFVGVECEPGLVLECEPACSRGDATACEIAGLGYLSGVAISRDLTRARIMLERACEKGRPQACSGWAKMAEDGLGVELSPERQAALLTLGCNDGDANACHRLGKRLLGTAEHPATPDNLKRANEFFDRACTRGDPSGCMELGIEAKTGRIGAKDVVKAVSWLTQACQHDLGTGCYELGDLQVSAGTAVNNPVRGRQNLDKACTLGVGAACAQLGQLMETGQKNIARAQTLHERACELDQLNSCLAVGRYQLATAPSAADRAFDKACNAGSMEACFERAKLLEGRTSGIDPAPEQALPLYDKACAAQVHPACSYAAELTLKEHDGKTLTSESRKRLVDWVRTGCETERQEQSCLVLARWLSTGENGVSREPKRAAELLGPLCAKASERSSSKSETSLDATNYGEACHRLGRFHETGQGVQPSALGALTLYERGCSAGYQPSCLARATLQWRGTAGANRDPEAAVAQFKRLCAEANDAKNASVGAEACIHLGFAQATGVGTVRDLIQAKSHFETYCSRGHQLACAHLGHHLVSNRGTEADRKRGEELLRSSCDSANGQGCLFLADLPRITKAHRKDLLARACQLDVEEACVFERVSSQ